MIFLPLTQAMHRDYTTCCTPSREFKKKKKKGFRFDVRLRRPEELARGENPQEQGKEDEERPMGPEEKQVVVVVADEED